MGRGHIRNEVVRDDGAWLMSRVDRILPSELIEKNRGSANKRQMCDVDAKVHVLLSSLVTKAADCLLIDVNWLRCQMLGGQSPVVSDTRWQ